MLQKLQMENLKTSPLAFYNSNKESTVEQLKENQPELFARYENDLSKTTVGFERANFEAAMRIKESQSNRYYKGQKVKYGVDLEYFKVYGVGIYLFFLFIQRVSILFFFMSLIELIPMIYNYVDGTALLNEGDGLQYVITRLTIGNQAALSSDGENESAILESKLFNVIPDIVISTMFFLFYFYWDRKSYVEAKKLRDQIALPSDKVIQVKKVSDDITEDEIEQFFNKFGMVTEVATVKNYSEMISLSKQIYELSLQMKEIRLLSSDETREKDLKKIQQKEGKIHELACQLQKIQQEGQKDIIKFYVSFREESVRNQVIQLYEKQQSCCAHCRRDPPEDLLIEGQLPFVKPCETQPGGIIWENIHITWKSRWIRLILQALLLLILIAFGFLLISFMNILNPSLTRDNIDTSLYTLSTIKFENTTVILSWCLSQDNPTTQISSYCEPFNLIYYKRVATSVGIALCIIVVKLLLKQIVIAIAKFQRYKDHTQLSTNIMINLMIIYICTTVLITFLLQANFFGISFKNAIQPFLVNSEFISNLNKLNEYSQLTADWYLDIGYQIWLNWLILALFPHLVMPIYHYTLEKLCQCLGKKQVLQKNVISYIRSEEFQIEDHYANLMMIIFVGFTFSGGIPFMVIISFLALVTRFLYFKYVFIRYCRIPKTYNHIMNSRMLSIFPVTLAFHFVFSLFMYGQGTIFVSSETNPLEQFIETTDVVILEGLAIIWDKISATWYFSMFVVFYLLIYFLKKIIVDCFMRLICGSNSEKYLEQETKKKDSSIVVQEIKDEKMLLSQKSLTKSYKLEKNPDYIEILAIMKPQQIEQIIRKTCVPSKGKKKK